MGVVTGITNAGPAGIPAELRTFRRTRVAIANAWPTGTAGWREIPWLEAISATESFGSGLGEAELRYIGGTVKQPDRPRFAYYALRDDDSKGSALERIAGRLVKLSLTDSVASNDPSADTALWYGIAVNEGWTIDGKDQSQPGNRNTYHAVGLGYLLHRIIPERGHELNADGDVAIAGEMLIFNDTDNGDRSQSKHDNTYVHDRRGGATVARWTAAQVAEYLLVRHGYQAGSQMLWTITGQTAALNYSDRWDLRGLSLWEALNVLVSSRLGLGMRVIVSGGQPAIEVTTGTREAVAIEDISIPANSRVTDVTTRDELWHGDELRVDEDWTTVYDDIRIVGRRPWSVMTLLYDADDEDSSDLEKGWSTTEESDWDGADEEERAEPRYGHVWRLWRLKSDWNGIPQLMLDDGGSDVDGLRNARVEAYSDDYGQQGETGVQYRDTARVPPAHQSIRATRILPVYEGYNYDQQLSGESLPATVKRTRPFLAPLVFIASDGSTWEDKSHDWQVTVLGNEIMLELGRNPTEAAEIAEAISTTGKLAITLAFEDVLPLRVRWKRPTSELTCGRVRQIEIPTGHELWYAYRGTAFRVDAGALVQIDAGKKLRDETARMREMLALAKLWYGEPARRLQWSEVGTIDTGTTYAPGSYIRNLISGAGSHPIEALITGRRWDLTERGFATHYTTDQIRPQLGAVR